MSTAQIITAILGVLGFCLSVISLIWQIRNNRPNLNLYPETKGFFVAKSSITVFPSPQVPPIETYVNLLHLLLGISNKSSRGNSIVSVSLECNATLLETNLDATYLIGIQSVPNPYLEDSNLNLEKYWTIPKKRWQDIIPIDIVAGGYIDAHIAHEIQRPLLGENDRIKVKIIVTDAFNKKYKKTINVVTFPPISPDVIPVRPPSDSSIKDDSKKRALVSL